MIRSSNGTAVMTSAEAYLVNLRHLSCAHCGVALRLPQNEFPDLRFPGQTEDQYVTMTFMLAGLVDSGQKFCCVPCTERMHSKTSIERHALAGLRFAASLKCIRSNCWTVCLCGPCSARKALDIAQEDRR